MPLDLTDAQEYQAQEDDDALAEWDLANIGASRFNGDALIDLIGKHLDSDYGTDAAIILDCLMTWLGVNDSPVTDGPKRLATIARVVRDR